jgi:hypothetical protein
MPRLSSTARTPPHPQATGHSAAEGVCTAELIPDTWSRTWLQIKFLTEQRNYYMAAHEIDSRQAHEKKRVENSLVPLSLSNRMKNLHFSAQSISLVPLSLPKR